MKISAALTVLFAFAGCAPSLDTVETEWTWRFDRGCVPPTEAIRGAMLQSAELWAQWGVSLQESDRGDLPHARVCLVSHDPREDFAGWASDRSTGNALIEVSIAEVPAKLLALVAHEFGHLVIGDHQWHLEQGFGIAASNPNCFPWAAENGLSCGWTDYDSAHLESFGLSR